MILVRESDILHKFQLQQLLIAVVDDSYLSQFSCFKGGTCAEMSGFLDRFSIDLDFDLVGQLDEKKIRSHINKITKQLDLTNENSNKESLFFNFKYKSPPNQRNTLKFSFYPNLVVSNDYEPRFLPEINRTVRCQTLETMFANKLVAPIDRFERHDKPAGRDIYDISYFFSQGYRFKEEIIIERTGLKVNKYIKKLIDFIEKEITQDVINQDLNTLLPLSRFNKVRKTLKRDALLYLKNTLASRGGRN